MGRFVRRCTLDPKKTVYMPRSCCGIGECRVWIAGHAACCFDVVRYMSSFSLYSLVK